MCYNQTMLRFWWLGLVLMFSPVLACGSQLPPDLYVKAVQYARAFQIDPNLLVAIVWVESRFCPEALGSHGEIGLGQILPSTAEALGVNPAWLWNVDWNLWAAAKHLRDLWNTFHNMKLVIEAYNAGAGAVEEGTIPLSTEQYYINVNYVYEYLEAHQSVLAAWLGQVASR
jgi:soluble lytic murein transglycosylase-like protein